MAPGKAVGFPTIADTMISGRLGGVFSTGLLSPGLLSPGLSGGVKFPSPGTVSGWLSSVGSGMTFGGLGLKRPVPGICMVVLV